MDFLVHEEEYRTKELIEKIAKIPVIFAGCGAVGSNLINNMARQGFKNLLAIDMDRVEEHNRGTQVWDRIDVGKLKTASMRNKIYNSVGTVIKTFDKKLTDENIAYVIKKFSLHPIIIDSFDNTEGRGLVYEYCKKNDLECLHVGLFQDFAEVIWNEDYIVPGEPKGLDVCEYPLARNVILLSVAVASETIIKYISDGVKKNYLITLKDMKITEHE